MFEVSIARGAKKSSKKLREQYRRRVVEFLLILRENPVPAEYYDIKKMKGFVDMFRARIGDIRIIYEVSWATRKVNVLLIAPRETAYS